MNVTGFFMGLVSGTSFQQKGYQRPKNFPY
jgi:hypothetical protein